MNSRAFRSVFNGFFVNTLLIWSTLPPQPTATPPVELASRIMTEEEEAELDRLRAERSQRGERARRGAFYAGNIFTEKKIGLDPSEEIEDPANSRSGIVSINSSISKSVR